MHPVKGRAGLEARASGSLSTALSLPQGQRKQHLNLTWKGGQIEKVENRVKYLG